MLQPTPAEDRVPSLKKTNGARPPGEEEVRAQVEVLRQVYTHEEAMEASTAYFNGDELAANVFVTKYALRNNEGRIGQLVEKTPEEMHRRLAREFARAESKYPNPMSEDEIFALFDRFRYVVPQGSPMSAIGNTYRYQSASNCFVVPPPYDSYGGILYTDQQEAQIMKRRGGVGFDISTLRPKGVPTTNAAVVTDGIAIFMERYSRTCNEVAQCLAAGTLVLTSKGLKPIEKVRRQDRVWTAEGWQVVAKTLKNKKPVVRIQTTRGLELRASKDHVFHTLNGETPVSEMAVGDPVTGLFGEGWEGSEVPLDPPLMGMSGNRLKEWNIPGTLTEDLAYLVGQIFGDGGVETAQKKTTVNHCVSIALSNEWPEIVDKVVMLTERVFGYRGRLTPGDGDLQRLRISSEQIYQFLAVNNLVRQYPDIEFPSCFLLATKPVLASFIAGYFDADGYVSGPKKGYSFSSTSRGFLSTLKVVLAAHGIATSWHEEDRSSKGWKTLYSVNVVGASSQRRFVTLLGGSSVKVSRDPFVAKRDNVLSIFNSRDLGVRYNKFPFCPDASQFMSRNTLDRLASEDVKIPAYATRMFNEEIQRIEEEGEEYTYDLVLEGVHLFFANGLYAHNSGRRGALMLTCDVHHPEILTFVGIKNDKSACRACGHEERDKVTGANVSVRLSDEFLEAVDKGEKYQLRWPCTQKESPEVEEWVDAREVWQEIMKNARESAEPGLLFWDAILRESPADCYADEGYRTVSTNPCAELPLSGNHDSCRLLALNLTSFVNDPFTDEAVFDFERFNEVAQKAQRLMDDLVDLEIELIDSILDKIISKDPEPGYIKDVERREWEQTREAALNGRRTGLGVTGLGDTLAMLGHRYGSDDSIDCTESIYKALAVASYSSSVQMAKERGCFPIYNFTKEREHPFINRVMDAGDRELRIAWEQHGRRNIANLTTAPTGSVSMMTQTTNGIEPVFSVEHDRWKKINSSDEGARVDRVDSEGVKWQKFTVHEHGFRKWREVTGKTDFEESPYYMAEAETIDWRKRVQLQAAAGKFVDHAISSTLNLPADVSVEEVDEIYTEAWKAGCKGITIYREGCREAPMVKKQSDFVQYSAPKRPDRLRCDIHRSRVKMGEGEYTDWLILVGLYDGKPYEIFGGFSENIEIPKRHVQGWIVKRAFKDGGKYDLHYGDEDDPNKIKNIVKMFDNPQQGDFTRILSLSLRHGAPVQFIVEQLGRTSDADMYDFAKVISRVLKKYIADGTKSKAIKVCPDCGAEDSMVWQENCPRCLSCGSSKCA